MAEAEEEFVTLTLTSLAPLLTTVAAMFMWNVVWYAPYSLYAQLSEKLAKFDITYRKCPATVTVFGERTPPQM